MTWELSLHGLTRRIIQFSLLLQQTMAVRTYSIPDFHKKTTYLYIRSAIIINNLRCVFSDLYIYKVLMRDFRFTGRVYHWDGSPSLSIINIYTWKDKNIVLYSDIVISEFISDFDWNLLCKLLCIEYCNTSSTFWRFLVDFCPRDFS